MRPALLIAFAALSLTACASTPEAPNDPFEPVNRAVLNFNLAADYAVVGPAARAYGAHTPGFIRTGIGNVLRNLREPAVFANLILQGQPGPAADAAFRFAANTTVGLGGLIDVAGREGAPRHEADFGQTLAVWGVGEGPYVVLPFLGPSSVRDTGGRVADRYAHPYNWSENWPDDTARWTERALRVGEIRLELEDTLAGLAQNREAEKADIYILLRETWRARRAAQIAAPRDQPAAPAPR
ncbi:MAG: VacJ family lipoprotein [Oceanicaulis sp.]|nr:VacJ family lipoprotein [Oceanicaulis sp.]